MSTKISNKSTNKLSLRRDERGLSTVEYVILLVLMAVAGIGVWNTLTGGLDRESVAALSTPLRRFRRGEPLALMPWTFVR